MEKSLLSPPCPGQGSLGERAWLPRPSPVLAVRALTRAVLQNRHRIQARAFVRTKDIPVMCEVAGTHTLGKREMNYLTSTH